MSLLGEKGDPGERGPTGDHGQTGDAGEPGARGATGPRRESIVGPWVGAMLGFVTGLALIIAALALVDAKRAISDQREGRRIAVTATCSAIGAVIDAGRATIVSGSVIRPREFELNLRELGLPPKKVREQGAETAADAYSRAIALRIEQQTGISGIVTRTGRLDCEKLRAVSRINPK